MKNPSRSAAVLVFVSMIMAPTSDLLSRVVSLPDASTPVQQETPAPERGFISSRPAKTWEQGLLSGNGTIGASVLSRPLDETVVFSHEHLFMPERDPILPPDLGPRLFEVRRMIRRGLYFQASKLAFDLSGQEGFLYPDCLVPAFDLEIRMEAHGEVTDYMRSVDFQTGEAAVRWADDRGVFERRLFVCRVDNVAVLLITGPDNGKVNCRLELLPRDPDDARFKANVSGTETAADESALTYRSGFVNAYPGSIHGYEGVARIVLRGGASKTEGSALLITGADQVLVFVDIAMLYDFDRSRIDRMKDRLAELPVDYDVLLRRHESVHGELFNRMRLDLGGGAADHGLATEVLLRQAAESGPSMALIEKEFDAARYNIISSTGELPPTLQGIWAGTFNPPWASDFTQNGNVPSAIACMLMGNMPELMLAYTSYIESLVPYLEVNAKRIFGARGIVLPSRTSTQGYNNAFCAEFAGAFWVGGTPWAAHFFYDYYLYTGDRSFLKEHALPFMEKTALFFEDYLFEGADGKYVFSPTQSPENTPGNSKSQASLNATMAVAAAKELLRNLIAASQELNVNQDKVPLWRRMLAKMPEYMINEDGAVKEWLTPALKDNYRHRHSSQLYALFDGMPEEIENNPALAAAFKRIIELKLDLHWKNWRKGGFMSFGLVQLGQAATGLGEKELAYRCLLPLIIYYWYPSLASTHNYKELFNMDISGGMPAVIIKMLADSRPGRIRLLPALPDAWPSGTIEGVLCRGQIEIKSLHWEEGLILVSLKSGIKQKVTLTAPTAIRSAIVTKGTASVSETGENTAYQVSLPQGQEVVIEIEL